MLYEQYATMFTVMDSKKDNIGQYWRTAGTHLNVLTCLD